MLITFDRQGYANNSSSSHSLVFSREIRQGHNDDYNEYSFNWDDFTITSRYAKESYLLTQWLISCTNYYDDDDAQSKIKNEIIEIFNELKKNPKTLTVFKHINQYYEDIKPEDEDEDYKDFSVDHQSTITWPISIITNKKDLDFFLDFCEEILENEDYVFLGGNDNSDGHPLKPDRDNNSPLLREHFISFYNSLIEQSDLYSIKDYKTNEWVLSSNVMGWIKKFIFNTDLVKNSINLNNPTTFFNGDNDNEKSLKKSGFPYLIDLKLSSFCGYGCEFCVPDDVMLTEKSILNTNINDKINSFNHNDIKLEKEEVSFKHEREYNGEMIIIEDEFGNVLPITPEHEVYTLNRGYIKAKDLTLNDDLVCLNNIEKDIKRIMKN
jgi:hypothetical protein